MATLLAGLLLCPLAAEAGTYSGPTYTDQGQVSDQNGVIPSFHYRAFSDDDSTTGTGEYGFPGYPFGPNGAVASSTDSGPITATFAWLPAYTGEPLPQSVIVVQASYPEAGTSGTTSGSAQVVSQSTQTDLPQNSNINYASQSGANSISATCSPTASISVTIGASGGQIQPYADVTYSASVSPVTIGLVGATSDGKGGWDVLVGQDVSPFLYGIPAACKISNYQWTVSGTTMQSWKVSSDSTHTTEVDGPGLLNTADPKWFWNDPLQATETVTCTATVTPPAGQGVSFSVTATQTVGVYLPTSAGKGLGGQMLIDANYFGAVNKGDFSLYASPAPTQPGGMTWEATLAPPQNCPVAFDKGNIYLVQVITPSVNYIDNSNQQWESVFQGQLGIDTEWPYGGGWATYEDDPYEPYYVSYDSPGLDLTFSQAIYGSYMSSFEDYIMYQPPDSPEYVPLRHFKWSVNSGDTIPSTNNWGDFKNPAGIVEPSGVTPFTQDNTYPSWTQNSGNTSNPWKKF